MAQHFRTLAFVVVSLFSVQAYAECPGTNIEEKLGCIKGLEFEEINVAGTPSEYRIFDMMLEQPVDHNDPASPTFKQRLVLFHKSENAPLVLQTSGYEIFSVGLTRLARDLDANQIQVEHRYFGDSYPEKIDWTKLNIEQSAADFHGVVTKFKPTYPKGWVNTGASKGGMTSIYHRRFYPDDLAATVALVAPHSYSTADERYITFVDNVGGERYKPCREKLEKFQQALLKNKDALIPKLGGTYEVVGGAAVAFEHAVIELPFIFWQYGNPEATDKGCRAIPSENASTDKLFSYMQLVNNAEEYFSDAGITPFVSYFFQAANQLGGPGSKLTHIEDLMDHKDTYHLGTYLPKDAPNSYDPQPMRDVQDWIANSSDGIMMIYGEYDPWTAGAYAPRRDGGDNVYYTVKAGNHGANHTLLSAADRKQAFEKLGSWLNIKITALSEDEGDENADTIVDNVIKLKPKKKVRYLEDIEAEIRARRHIGLR